MCVRTDTTVIISASRATVVGSVVYSKLEVMGCCRIEGERSPGFQPVDLGRVLAALSAWSKPSTMYGSWDRWVWYSPERLSDYSDKGGLGCLLQLLVWSKREVSFLFDVLTLQIKAVLWSLSHTSKFLCGSSVAYETCGQKASAGRWWPHCLV